MHGTNNGKLCRWHKVGISTSIQSTVSNKMHSYNVHIIRDRLAFFFFMLWICLSIAICSLGLSTIEGGDDLMRLLALAAVGEGEPFLWICFCITICSLGLSAAAGGDALLRLLALTTVGEGALFGGRPIYGTRLKIIRLLQILAVTHQCRTWASPLEALILTLLARHHLVQQMGT